MPKFTVVGLCEVQRHAFCVTARNAAEAERKCVRDHDKETGFRLVVAGVLKGPHEMADTCDTGLDAQLASKKGSKR